MMKRNIQKYPKIIGERWSKEEENRLMNLKMLMINEAKNNLLNKYKTILILFFILILFLCQL